MWVLGISAAIVILGIFFMVFFQKNLRALIDRIKRLKYGRTEIQAETQPQNTPDTKPDITEQLMRQLDSPVLREREDLINEQLKKVGVQDGPDKEKVLIRYLATANLALIFERTDRLIWGSQLYILEYLNDRRPLGVLKEDIKTAYYDEAAKRWPIMFENYPYEDYLNFLKNSGLVIEKDGNLVITVFGVQFLQYLTAMGRSQARLRPF